MNSYNDYSNIKRIKCTNNETTEFVSLREYIIFENEDEQKYAIFKLQNNLEQYLYEVKFIVTQYDEKGNIIEKSTISYKGFRVDGQEYLVPDAKFKCNQNCDTISMELTYGVFERIIFDNGNVIDVKYDYLDYKGEQEKKAEEAEKKASKSKSKEKVLYKDKKSKKKRKSSKKNVTLKDITKQNKTNKMATFNILFSIIIIGICALFCTSFKNGGNTYRENGVVYALVRESSGNKVYHVVGFEGTDKATISLYVNDTQVTAIESGAFKKSSVQEVYIFAPIEIQSNAFTDCENLENIVVQEDQDATFRALSIVNCPNLKKIQAIGSTFNINAISASSTTSLSFMSFGATNASKFADIFQGIGSNYDVNSKLTVKRGSHVSADIFVGFSGTLE